jgi:two-component system, sensor histidine kinase LadS
VPGSTRTSYCVCAGQILLAILLLGWGLPVRAAAPVRLAEHCRLLLDPSTSPASAARQLELCADPAPSNAAGTIWVDYRDPPMLDRAGQIWRLAFDNHQVEHLDFWLLGPNGYAKHIPYDPKAADREWAAGNYFSIPFIGARSIDRILVRLQGAENYTLIRGPKLAEARAFTALDRNRAALYGIGVGLLALTILFHLSLFFAIRRRFQLVYSVHVGLLLVYSLCYSGIIMVFAPQLSAGTISRLLSFAMAAATASGTLFVVEFLGYASLPRLIRRWALTAAAASFAAALLLAFAPPGWGALVFTGANLAGLHAILVTTALLVIAIARGERTSFVLAAGWAFPIGVSLMYPARTLGLISDAALPDGLMMIAMTAECLILSLPVAGRIRNLRIEHERAHERHVLLERQAQTDALTGLANRRGFGAALARVTATGLEAVPMALLVIDIDHFKRVNDQHGHATGDNILRYVAAHVARVAGSGAIVARYGGEEFVVALRGYDLVRASTLAERIRNSIGFIFEGEAELPRVTISIGVAAGLSDEIETLLCDADAALYRAKDDGRDRVMLADGAIIYAAAA